MFEVVATTDWQAVWHTGFVIVSLAGTFAVFACGLAIGKARGLKLADMSVDGLNASYSNSAYIGFPLMYLTFGAESRPFVVIAATLTLMVLFAASIILIEIAQHHGQRGHVILAKDGRSVLRNPIVMSPLPCLGWWLPGIPLPKPAHPSVSLLVGAMSAWRPFG